MREGIKGEGWEVGAKTFTSTVRYSWLRLWANIFQHKLLEPLEYALQCELEVIEVRLVRRMFALRKERMLFPLSTMNTSL